MEDPAMAKTGYMLPLAALLACLLIALPGCRKLAPVQNFSSPMPLVQKENDKNIASAIIRAGAMTGWEIVPVRPGLMTGTLAVRGKHTAVVDIAYDKQEYKITYRSSSGLKYDNGRIHPQYNKWVTTLDNNIRREIAGLTR
jgi:hypothetical protein